MEEHHMETGMDAGVTVCRGSSKLMRGLQLPPPPHNKNPIAIIWL